MVRERVQTTKWGNSIGNGKGKDRGRERCLDLSDLFYVWEWTHARESLSEPSLSLVLKLKSPWRI